MAAIGWSSFLAACFGTLLTFAALDPQVIIEGVERGDDGSVGRVGDEGGHQMLACAST